MIMSTPTDDDLNHLKPKKEKVIVPPSQSGPQIPGANEDLLAELRAKTARLAEQVHGSDDPVRHVLKLDEQAARDEDIIEALRQDRPGKPLDPPRSSLKGNPALELVRSKLAKLYKGEPDAAEEALESYQAGGHRSRHQRFMYELTTSGKSLADIQTEWHEYYVALSDDEKHEVWREFYDTQRQTGKFAAPASKPKHKSAAPAPAPTANRHPATLAPSKQDPRSVAELKAQLLDTISAGGRLNAVHHAKSLLFGLGLAAFVGLVITFTFFNEVFIAPFISPSRTVSATPIVGSAEGEIGPEPKIIIPKINLEVPIVFGMDTIDEEAVQHELENGVVHYATTPNPGEKGNVAIFGHSSNNILNKGRYKFAFVLLKRLETEDTFFVHKDGIRYTYKVYKKEIVTPDQVSVLEPQDKANTITLITCDPPGTSLNRLIIVAEQISPDPNRNTESTALKLNDAETSELPSNAPSLWSRLWPF